MSMVHIGDDLPHGTFSGLPSVRERDRRDVLIPIRNVRTLPEVDVLTHEVAELVEAHADTSVASLAQTFLLAVSELTGNAVEHGRNSTGAYLAAQRYRTGQPDARLVIAVADLGMGIPEHVRQRYPEWTDDAQAIENATIERVSGTGNPHRGFGISQVLDEIAASPIEHAELQLRAGRGVLRSRVIGMEQLKERREVPYKRGTWVTLELGTA